MPRLQCDATGCASNQHELCCRPIIKVEGAGACSCEETCCKNFVQRGQQPTNAAMPDGYTDPNTTITIKCAATDCSHNRNRMCSAATVTICGMGAADSDGTSCRSFEAKS